MKKSGKVKRNISKSREVENCDRDCFTPHNSHVSTFTDDSTDYESDVAAKKAADRIALNDVIDVALESFDEFIEQVVPIRIVDLCKEDKKRIVNLVEELTKQVECNKILDRKLSEYKTRAEETDSTIDKLNVLHEKEKVRLRSELSSLTDSNINLEKLLQKTDELNVMHEKERAALRLEVSSQKEANVNLEKLLQETKHLMESQRECHDRNVTRVVKEKEELEKAKVVVNTQVFSLKKKLYHVLKDTARLETSLNEMKRDLTTAKRDNVFPILRPSSYRMYLRTMRMKSERAEEGSLQQGTGRAAATLVGHVGRTFLPETAVRETKDMYAVDATGQQVRANRFGINDNDREYAESKWCYDTPGTVQPDQVINMLTTEELMRSLPKKLLHPRSFSLTPGKTIFVAGLGRLDYLAGDKAIRFTVLASAGLPLTVCRTADADRLYAALLGSELLAVPCGGPDRLAQWPRLVAGAGTIRLTGEDWRRSCADVVLSSAGWIAVTPGPEMIVELRAWTPDGRGIHVRPPLLRYAVNYRGPRITRSPAYKPGIGLYRRAP